MKRVVSHETSAARQRDRSKKQAPGSNQISTYETAQKEDLRCQRVRRQRRGPSVCRLGGGCVFRVEPCVLQASKMQRRSNPTLHAGQLRNQPQRKPLTYTARRRTARKSSCPRELLSSFLSLFWLSEPRSQTRWDLELYANKNSRRC